MRHTIRNLDELAEEARAQRKVVDFHLVFTLGELELISRAMGSRTIQAAKVAEWVEQEVLVALDELKATRDWLTAQRQRQLPMADPSDHVGAVDA